MSDVAPSLPAKRRFATFELDLASGELYDRGRKVPLQEQPFKVLARLTREPGVVVSRDDLKRELWPDDTFVGFAHGLNEAVNRVRRALHDSAEHPRFVETLPKRGYRFIAPVESAAAILSIPAPSAADPDERTPVERPTFVAPPSATIEGGVVANVPASSRAFPVGRGVVIAVAATALALTAVAWRVTAPEAPRPEAIRGLAVLPFGNLSGDRALDYIADGFTEELTTTLASIDGLRVASRGSSHRFKDTTDSAATVAAALRVDGVIEGSIRIADERLRVTARLVSGATDTQLWSSTFERPLSDVLSVQREISMAIARELHLELRTGPAPYVPANGALTANLKGRYQLNRRTPDGFAAASEFFRQAISIDPDYPAPRAGLAETYALIGIYNLAPPSDVMPKARVVAGEALALDPALASPHVALGWTSFMYEWNWADAERAFNEALRLEPANVTAHQGFGVFLAAMGRPAEAEKALTHALELDPLSLSAADTLGWFWYTRNDLGKAEGQYRQLLELDPTFGQAHRYLGLVRLRAGDPSAARASLERAQALLEGSAEPAVDLAMALALTGNTAKAVGVLADLLAARKSGRYVSAALLAGLYESLGRREEALTELERAERERATTVVLASIDPIFSGMASEPRFRDLLARVGLPAASVDLRP